MNEYIFGSHILESLTTGMYRDPKTIYREYIQNACDSIDHAIAEGVLRRQNRHDDRLDVAEIYIEIDKGGRTISIEDNALGIRAEDFRRVLGNIADSDKTVDKDKGFRGIGRLCGLAYCRELIFTSKYRGEAIESVMRCDAEGMRRMFNDGKKYAAVEVLNAINTFESRAVEDRDAHYFRVELIGVRETNDELLDPELIREYLSFVAPVEYSGNFIYREQIHEHAKQLGFVIDEYEIIINGESLVKEYKASFDVRNDTDNILAVGFKDFHGADGVLEAWLWIGLSHFKAKISAECSMRGIRLRKKNFQIGDSNELQRLFREERGINYFVGEVFINEDRGEVEDSLRKYFNGQLQKIYRLGSECNRIRRYEAAKFTLEDRIKLEVYRRNAEDARRSLDKAWQQYNDDRDSLVAEFLSLMRRELAVTSSKPEEPSPAEPSRSLEPRSPSRAANRSPSELHGLRSIAEFFYFIGSECVDQKIINAETAEKIIARFKNKLRK